MFRQSTIQAARLGAIQRAAIRRYAIDSKTPLSAASTTTSLPSGTSDSPLSGSPIKPIPAVIVPANPTLPVKPVIVTRTTTLGGPVTPATPLPTATAKTVTPPLNDDLPPPPPNSNKPRRSWTRRILFYLTLSTLIFYPTSALISQYSNYYRDLFTQTFPGAEALVDYADDNDWDRFGPSSIVTGAGSLVGKAKDLANGVDSSSAATTASNTAKNASAAISSAASDISNKAQELKDSAAKRLGLVEPTKTQKAVAATENGVADLKREAVRKANEARKAAGDTVDTIESKSKQVALDAEAKALELKKKGKSVVNDISRSVEKKTSEVKGSVEKKAEEVKQGVKSNADHAVSAVQNEYAGLVAALPTEKDLSAAKQKFSDGVQSLVDQAENALGHAKKDIQHAEEEVKQEFRDVTGAPHGEKTAPENVQARLVDTMPARGLKAGPPAKKELKDDSKGGKKPYTGPPLPLGFEAPPGYYIPKNDVPTTSSDAVAVDGGKKSDGQEGIPTPVEKKEVLPLLAPKVAEFTSAKDEPIISQLASTIDSLAESLQAANTGSSSSASTSPTAILSKAQDDLNSLSTRLEGLKAEEKVKLEKSVEDKTREFEQVLKTKEEEWKGKEGELMEGWKEERERVVEGWRKVLDRELEGQRVGIEQRLREEVIAQGIELQRRWLRSIKAQVESERGGRLAKLDTLSTSFKQLERITLDNSSQLDANVQLHTLWSALRAVQAKVERGDVAFDDELRVLKSAAHAQTAASNTSDDKINEIVATMIASVEKSGAAVEGIKSFPALASWFSSSVSPKIQSVSLVPAEHEAGVLSHLASAALSKVLFTRKAGWVEGNDVGSVLARAEYLLAEKDLDGAAREVNQLQGWAGKLAGDWLREARKRLAVEQALLVVGTEATLASLLLV